MTPSQEAAPGGLNRIDSLDHFRGFAVWGMLVVNFLASFVACPEILRHHNTYCSYADVVMPQFLFAVGFAYRLTFTRRKSEGRTAEAYLRTLRRLAGLALVAVVVYAPGARASDWQELTELGVWGALAEPLKRSWFQTLMHIAATTLWLLPVIGAKARTIAIYAAASGAAHIVLSYAFNFNWTYTPPNAIDGGPLGFLTWTVPAAAGAVAYDVYAGANFRPKLTPLIAGSVVLMLCGYLLSCPSRWYEAAPRTPERTQLAASPVAWPPAVREHAWSAIQAGRWSDLFIEAPLVPPPSPEGDLDRSFEIRPWNYWMMCQRAGTLSYTTFAAGFALATFLAFHVICDLWGMRLFPLEVFGRGALVAYVLHMMVDAAVTPFTTRDAPAWYMWLACGLFAGITYLFVRSLDRAGVRIRL